MSRTRVIFPTAALLLAFTAGASADTTLLDENFDSLTQAQFEIDWTVPATTSSDPGPTTSAFIASGGDEVFETFYPATALGEGESAAATLGRIGDSNASWNGLNTGNAITPTDAESIFLAVDLYDNNSGNKRQTLGLRTAAGANIIEMGFYNQEAAQGYAHRAIVFPGTSENPNPNWQPFEIDPSLDRDDDFDNIANSSDVGSGWHRYSVLITPTQMTFELDLFRDGFTNIRDESGEIVTGAAGVDASVTYDIDASASAFDSLRLGGPSNLSSLGTPPDTGGTLYDNLLLQLLTAGTGGGVIGDLDNSGQVEQGDLNLVLLNWGQDAPFTSNGDPFNDLQVNQEELNQVLLNWGSGAAPSFEGFESIPEPASLALLGGLAVLGLRRR